MTATRALPKRYRKAYNLDEGYEVCIGTRDGADVWAVVTHMLDILGPIPLVSLTVDVDGTEVHLPGVGRHDQIMSRRPAGAS